MTYENQYNAHKQARNDKINSAAYITSDVTSAFRNPSNILTFLLTKHLLLLKNG